MSNPALPRRRTILLARRMEMEQKQEHERQVRLRKERRKAHSKALNRFSRMPLVRFMRFTGSGLWALALSLVLTLFATYLCTHVEVYHVMTQIIKNTFSVSVAGAAERKKTMTAHVTVQRRLPAELFEDREELLRSFPPTLLREEKGYRGYVRLKRVEVTPVTHRCSAKADKELVFEHLPTNDVSQLDAEHLFRLRSDETFDAEADVFLKSAEWQWEVSSYDSYGLPSEYKATVIYRGREQWRGIAYLETRAFYEGSLSLPTPPVKDVIPDSKKKQTVLTAPSDETSEVVVIVHDTTEAPVAGRAGNVARQIERVGLQKSLWWWLPAVIGAMTATTGLGAVAVVYYRRRKKRDEEISEDGVDRYEEDGNDVAGHDVAGAEDGSGSDE